MNVASTQENERRKKSQRRHVDLGPPSGILERRVNIERRLFSFGPDSGEPRYGLELKSTFRDS